MLPTNPDLSDDELMTRLQTGNDGALNEIMERWETPIRSYLCRYLNNEAVAMDVAQETFVRLYQNKGRYKAGTHFKSWLFTIATNLARTHNRWKMRHPTEPLQEADEPTNALPTMLRDDTTPATSLREREQIEAVRNAISKLPEELRTAVLLFEYERLSYAEIAAVMDCSNKAVETRLYRAKQILRAALTPYFK